MWFNVKEARQQLLENGFVYTLRPKPYRLRKKLTAGSDILMFDEFKKKGSLYFHFITTIKENHELEPFIEDSGFNSVEEWIMAARGNRCLFFVMLLDGRIDIEVIYHANRVMPELKITRHFI